MKERCHLDLWNEMEANIAQGCNTNSKHKDRHPETTFYPRILSGGRGHMVWCYDEGGNKREYISYDGAIGSDFWGNSNGHVLNKALPRMSDMLNAGLGTPSEIGTAKLLKGFFPFVDKWKFRMSGSSACAMSVRFARAHTKRELVLSDGYHGDSDMFVSLTQPSAGVPKDKNMAQFTDLKQITDKVAAVIIEPVQLDWSRERMKYLHELREICDKTGTMLIFDEVITNLRFKSNSVSSYSGVTPDLIVIGKACGGGAPLSAVGGKSKIMDNPEVFCSTTFAGCTIQHSFAIAALTALGKYSDFNLDDLWGKGQRFMDEFNAMGKDIQIEGYPTRGAYKYKSLEKFTIFRQECARAGILIGNSHFYSFGHPEHDDMVLSTLQMIFDRLHRGEYKLEGKLPTSPFSAKQRGAKNGKSSKKSKPSKRASTRIQRDGSGPNRT